MSGRLAGKVAIISGGATGMGGAASRLFAAEGAKVAIIDRNEQASAATVSEIAAAGGQAAYFVADVDDSRVLTRSLNHLRSGCRQGAQPFFG